MLIMCVMECMPLPIKLVAWLMKFLKIVQKMEKMRCNERNLFLNS